MSWILHQHLGLNRFAFILSDLMYQLFVFMKVYMIKKYSLHEARQDI